MAELAWACPACNGHKYAKTRAPDPRTGRTVDLFNPRRQRWPRHFTWSEWPTNESDPAMPACEKTSEKRLLTPLTAKKTSEKRLLTPLADLLAETQPFHQPGTRVDHCQRGL
jgi:hypothetical protein